MNRKLMVSIFRVIDHKKLMHHDKKITITHDSLAAETASGRAFVSRRLGEFAKRGLVKGTRGRVHLLDRAGLERIAGQER